MGTPAFGFQIRGFLYIDNTGYWGGATAKIMSEQENVLTGVLGGVAALLLAAESGHKRRTTGQYYLDAWTRSGAETMKNPRVVT